jgi:tetratricopeptide (TPR) repeat protein
VPLATFCGWRLRNPAFSNSLGRNAGRIWPFPADAAARDASGDPRSSIAERYATSEDYLSRVRASLARLREDRLILPEDHDRMLTLAEKQAQLIGQIRSIAAAAVDMSPAAAKSYFEQVSEADLEWLYGHRGGIRHAINEEGYRTMWAGDVKLAEAVFRLNTRLYPDDGNVWDSLAECFFNQKRWGEAREAYERSLVLSPDNQNARDMLERIAELE